MKKIKILLTACFFLFLLCLSILSFALPSASFSETENRLLAQKPRFSVENIRSGGFQKELSAFLGDHIPLREQLIKLNVLLKRLSGKTMINGVYVGKKGYYIRKFTDEDFQMTRAAAVFGLINDFAAEHKDDFNTYVLLVPNPSFILRDKLPAGAPVFDENKVMENGRALMKDAEIIDLTQAFEEENSRPDGCSLYYRTDHHWTAFGALKAYNCFAKSVGCTPHAFMPKRLCSDFYGTVYSKLPDLKARPDSIFAPEIKRPLRVICDGSEGSSLYSPKALKKKDKYQYFFGGNFSEIIIDTGVKRGRTLLIIKDSFANSFVPYLVNDWDRIVMVDLRFFEGDLNELCRREGVTDTLFLYEISNLLTDTGILKLSEYTEGEV